MTKRQYSKKDDALTMTVDEVAEALGVSKYLVWEMVRRNEIRSIKLGIATGKFTLRTKKHKIRKPNSKLYC